MKGYVVRGAMNDGSVFFLGKGGMSITGLVYGGTLTIDKVYEKRENAMRKRRALEKINKENVEYSGDLDDLVEWSVAEVEWGC